ncbi:MAG: glycosyltransferase [Flavobacteriales bacterium]|nr:glycosyltransferase [Flavobacteriales bacterium]
MTPKVSIIVPIYNVQEYLERCVNSLINQTLKEIEIILVNDGSTDDSEKIMLELAENDERIKPFTKENGGLSDARNFGLRQCDGEYVAFVDSDDWIDEKMIETMYNHGNINSCEMVICNLHKVNEYGKVFRPLPQLHKNQELVIDLTTNFSVFGELSWFACNKIFKRELFNGIEFTKNMHFEDIATTPILLLKCTKLGFCQEYFYNYFEREGSITRNFTAKGLDMFRAISIVRNDFVSSKFHTKKKEWKRFLILNGFYSFLAYTAQVKDKKLKTKMYATLDNFLGENNIHKREIINYRRFEENYLFSLSWKKIVYYTFHIFLGKQNIF